MEGMGEVNTSAGAERPTSFNSLPQEVKKQILCHTGLIMPRQCIGLPQGFIPREGMSRQGVPGPLFFISGEVSQLARSILFSENRIILRGFHEEDCNWLKRQRRELLQQIRRLDLYMDITPDPTTRGPYWDEIVSLIEKKFDLQKLTLSIDAVHGYADLEENYLEEGSNLEWLKDQYEMIIEPFRQRSKHLSELRAFFVYWPKFASLESKAEKAVMGKEYKSSRMEKIPFAERDWRLPHGWEWEKTDADGNLTEDWLDYNCDRKWMRDVVGRM